MKVAYILGRFPVLSETFVNNEILSIASQGIDISIYAFTGGDEPSIPREIEASALKTNYALNPKDNIRVFLKVFMANLSFLLSSPLGFSGYFFKYFFKIGKKEFSQVFYLCRLMKKRKPEYLHAHFASLGAIAALVASKFLKVPFGVTVHAHDIFTKNIFLEEILMNANCIIAISNYNKSYLLGKYPKISSDKIKVLHCAVDAEKFTVPANPVQASRKIINIISIGRLIEKKGFIYLIKACKLLADKGLDFSCEIFGDGPLEPELSSEIKKLGLEKNVYLRGKISPDEVACTLLKKDIFVLPSVIAEDGDRDGIPVVLMEAMVLEKAVISTDISGIPEIINSGENGILVSQKDEIKLSEVISELIKDTGLRQRLSNNAREKIKREFNLPKNAALLIGLFRRAAHNRQFRILYVNGTSEIGGAEVSLLSLLKKINRDNYSPLVAVPRHGPLLDRIKTQGVEVKIASLMEFSCKRRFRFLLSALRLAFLIKKEKIDLVHANSIYIAEQSYFAAKFAGVPCICHIRDLVPILGAGKLRSIAFKNMQKLIAISEAVKKDLIEKLHIPENKVIRIYNGVDTDEFYPDISGQAFRNEFNLGSKKLVGMIARFSPEKGQEVFLKAAAEVIKEYSEVNFIIAGDAKLGSESFKEEMAGLSKKLGLQNKVVFTGFREDLASVLAAWDILVSPSQAEPFGRVIIEAMAMGKPAIASNSGASGEILNDETGFLITPGDINGFAGAILTLLRDEKRRKEMGTMARKAVVERFGINRHRLEVEALYSGLLKG